VDPEPRWPAWIAVLSVGGLYTALPPYLIVGPRWLFLVIVLALLIPTVVSHHKGHHQLNKIFERTWNAPLYLNYGQTEAFGALGVECREQNGYHRNDLHFAFEMVDANADGEGELVYTTLTRDVVPLIRYRSTDITRLIEEPCACGLFAKRLAKIRARCDEMVVCGTGNVGPWVFAELLRGVSGAADEWQAVIKHDRRRDIVELHVETDEALHEAELERILWSHLRERFADFWKNHEMGLYELRVIAAPRASLRRARKLQRVVDERQMLMRSVI